MRHFLFISLITLALFTTAKAQTCADSVHLRLNVSFENDEMIVDLVADGFTDIIGFQVFLNYDKEVLEGIESTSQSLGSQILFNTTESKVSALFLAQAPSFGVSLPDNSVLFTSRFKVLEVSSDPGFSISDTEFISSFFDVICVFQNIDEFLTTGTKVYGQLLIDKNENCAADAGDEESAGWIVTMSKGNQKFNRITDEHGNYNFGLQPGLYTFEVYTRNNLWGICTYQSTIEVIENQPVNIDLLAYPLFECANISLDLSTPRLRRCFDNVYTLKYENTGTINAEDKYIEVALDDDLTFVSTTYPDFIVDDQKIRFNLPDLSLFDKGLISFTANLNCENTVLGQTHCVTATSLPHSPCIVNPLWGGADIELSGRCDEVLDKVIFSIKNIGVGDMSSIKQYIVTEDDVMSPPLPYSLLAGQEVEVELPANGSTYRIIAEEDEYFPFTKKLTLALEGCDGSGTGNFSTGFVNQFSELDYNDFTDVECKQSIGSYDPNDISGTPRGYGNKKYVDSETKMEYLIRFQNTGTDTAFTVLIKNKIPEGLDLSTFELGASSHNYQYKIEGERMLVIKYNNIYLPDSNINEPASHGFIKYSAFIDKNLPLESIVQNKADIFFDFNPAVETNTEFNTVGLGFVITGIEYNDDIGLKIFPNPTASKLVIQNDMPLDNVIFDMYSESGKKVLSGTLNHTREIDVDNLQPGLYYTHLKIGGNRAFTIKFIKSLK